MTLRLLIAWAAGRCIVIRLTDQRLTLAPGAFLNTQAVKAMREKGKPVREVRIEPLPLDGLFFSRRVSGYGPSPLGTGVWDYNREWDLHVLRHRNSERTQQREMLQRSGRCDAPLTERAHHVSCTVISRAQGIFC